MNMKLFVLKSVCMCVCVCECVCVSILVQEPITEKKDDNMSFSLMEFNAHRATIHILHNTKKNEKKFEKKAFLEENTFCITV